MSDLPEPMTPPDCDLRDFPFMPLDCTRLLDSDLFALARGDEFKAAVALWCKSWSQVPTASLPDDERVLAHLSGAGAAWRKLRTMALRGWVRCADGRLYHPIVAEKANEAWAKKRKAPSAGKRGAAAKWQTEQAQDHAATRSERLAEARKKGSHTTAEWQAMKDLFGPVCLRCNTPAGKVVKDHITPIYKGGSDGIENLQPLCATCNSAKGPDTTDHRSARLPDWRERLDERLQMPGMMPARTPDERLQMPGNRQGQEESKQAAKPLPSFPDSRDAGPERDASTRVIQPRNPAPCDPPEAWLHLADRNPDGSPKREHEPGKPGHGRPIAGGFYLDVTAQMVAEEAGWPADWRGDWTLLAEWLRAGIDPNDHIVPTVKRLAAALRAKPTPEVAGTLRYFNNAVRTAAGRMRA